MTFMTIGVGAPRVPPARRGAGPEACAVDLDEAERAAIDVLARSGLVPPLRMERAM